MTGVLETTDSFFSTVEDWPTARSRISGWPITPPTGRQVPARVESLTRAELLLTRVAVDAVVALQLQVDAMAHELAALRRNQTRAGGALAALDRVGSLGKNWDTYGSPPMPDAAVRQARAIVILLGMSKRPEPTVSPVPGGGGVQLEWNVGPKGLEVYVEADGQVSYLLDDGSMTEGKLGHSPSLAAFRIQQLVDGLQAVR